MYAQYGARCWAQRRKRWSLPVGSPGLQDTEGMCVCVGGGQLLPGCKPGQPFQRRAPCRWMCRVERCLSPGMWSLCWPFDSGLGALWGIRLSEEDLGAQGWPAGCPHHSTSERIPENRELTTKYRNRRSTSSAAKLRTLAPPTPANCSFCFSRFV